MEKQHLYLDRQAEESNGGLVYCNRIYRGFMVKYFMVKQLQKVLSSVEKELKNDKSIWDKDQIAFIIRPEIEELLSHFEVGTVFFKYGKKQRMLSSTYIITDSMKKLRNTNLGKDILKLQNIYNKL